MILKLCLLVGIVVYFSVITSLVTKDKIYLKYALLWYALGIVFVVFAIWPSCLVFVMKFLGIYDPVNGLFAFLFFFLFIFFICLLSTISRLNTSNKKLVQKVALLEKRIVDLKQNLALKEKEQS